ncbi:MAG: prepilin-type N-terminal cleavage/methylation domain-containing protein [Terrimicrobiaceae bacterium]|nr:prepilin-type N-terminal cleavage/methylation domain-containing protein [Terrimicrobiaceae bacterium]
MKDPGVNYADRNARKAGAGFTLLELLVVIAIIAILAGLILSTAGFIQRKGATSRAQAEIAALSAALESYKADMGDYPGGSNANPTTTGPITGGNAFLRAALAPLNTNNSINPLGKVYFEFPVSMGTNKTTPSATNQNVLDPFGEPYGYVYTNTGTNLPRGTMNGTNFFDLWSRAGTTNSNQWITNW